MPLNKTIFIAGFMAVLIICLALWLHQQQPAAPALKITPVKTQEKRAAVQEAIFQQKIDSLMRKEKSIDAKLKNTRALLSVAKEKNRKLQARVNVFLSEDDSSIEDEDSSCDTLKASVNRLLIAQSEKDNLQDSLTIQMEWQLGNKDTIITMQQQRYLSLKAYFDNSLLQQKMLENQNGIYRRTIRKQRAKQKLFLIGLSALTVFSVKQLLKR